MVEEGYCQRILQQIEMNISIDRVLKGLWQLEHSLESQCLRASLRPSPVFNFNYQLMYSNDLEEEEGGEDNPKITHLKPIKKEWYSWIYSFDMAPLTVELYSNDQEKCMPCARSLYIVCFLLLLGLFLGTGIIY